MKSDGRRVRFTSRAVRIIYGGHEKKTTNGSRCSGRVPCGAVYEPNKTEPQLRLHGVNIAVTCPPPNQLPVHGARVGCAAAVAATATCTGCRRVHKAIGHYRSTFRVRARARLCVRSRRCRATCAACHCHELLLLYPNNINASVCTCVCV